jgi:[protein-PII] uridylyltransferase
VCVESGLAPSPDLTDALGVAAEAVTGSVREDPDLARAFLALLARPGAGRGLRALADAGFLGEYLPEFGRLACLCREDPAHQYTVDEHTLRAVEALDALAAESATVREELARVERSDLLRLALLLHDVGKSRGGDHVAEGLAMLPEITARLGLSEGEAGFVRFLVLRHVLLTRVADRRTPRDAAREVAEACPDRNRLRCLYLLTLADVAAAGRGALSGWREAQILKVYEDALRVLSPRPSPPFLARLVEVTGRERKEEARVHLEGMGDRYMLEVEPSRAALHLDLAARLDRAPAALACLPGEAWGEVWVVARDACGLFARIAGVLALRDLDIGGAQAYTRSDGVAVDGFFVTRDGEAPPEDPEFWREVGEDLCEALGGDLDLEGRLESLRNRFRPEPTPGPPGPPPGAWASDRVSERYAVVEVTARDRPALLHDLAAAITGQDLSIQHAVIATRGPVVMDTFYVVGPDGARPTPDQTMAMTEALRALVEAEA